MGCTHKTYEILKRFNALAIEYSGFPDVLEGYSDANWISDSDETKSTDGYVFTLGGGVITWRSTRQTIIATSTMESDFVALELAGKGWVVEKLLRKHSFMKEINLICVNTLWLPIDNSYR